jgi:hypothetical protein
MNFGQHLRPGAGVSWGELPRRAGGPASTLRNWEGDRGKPGLPASRRLAAVLGVPVERFTEGVEDPAEEEPAARLTGGRPSTFLISFSFFP